MASRMYSFSLEDPGFPQEAGLAELLPIKGRLNEKKIFQENSALQNLGPKIIHEPKNLKKKFRKKFFFENTATSK